MYLSPTLSIHAVTAFEVHVESFCSVDSTKTTQKDIKTMFRHCSWSQDTKFDLGKVKWYLMVLLVPSFSFFFIHKESAKGAVEILAAPPSPEEDQVINFSL